MTNLRVLLLSPVRGLDPPNGDVTYTEQLLAHPPPGVAYTTYDQALADGSLVEHLRRRPGERETAAVRREGIRLVREVAVNAARRQGLLFREPFRHMWVDAKVFDLVHVHVFSTRLDGGVPFVVSNSIQVDRLYRDAFRVPDRRVRSFRIMDRWLAKATGVCHSAYGQSGASRVICFSQHLKETFLQDGETDASRLVVIPPGIELSALAINVSSGLHVGFVGDWEAKGGPAVLRAYRRLRMVHPTARLTIVGGEARLSPSESERLGITWMPRLSRDTLLREVAPTFSVFAYPSRFDGLPLTLLEMMALGVAPLVSDYGALPEVVGHGEAGIVVGLDDDDSLAEGLLTLADAACRRRFSQAARKRIEAAYSSPEIAKLLGQVYREAC